MIAGYGNIRGAKAVRLIVLAAVCGGLAGCSGSSTVAGSCCVVAVPGTPTGLTVTNVTATTTASQTELNLTWQAGTPAGLSFSVFRSTTQGFTPGTTNQIATGVGTASYVDTGLSAGVRYYYAVQGATSAGSSGDSAQSYGTTYTSVPPGVAILVDANASSQVLTAVADLQNDLLNVFGKASTMYTSEAAIPGYATSPVIVITQDSTSASVYKGTLTATESHSVGLVESPTYPMAPQRVLLQGADMRGTIYAIYEFSDSILGVPPLYHWSGWTKPSPSLTQIAMTPNYLASFGTPVIKYRGVFPNDEDMMNPWMSASTANFNSFFETLLRLKLNLLDVGAISDVPSTPTLGPITSTGLARAQACKARGLIVTFTHTSPFGASFGDWTNFWNWTYKTGGNNPSHAVATIKDQASLNTFWTHYINLATANGLETMQTIAFRGSTDEAWWLYMPADDPGTDQGRASVIANELSDELALYTTLTGQSNPLMRTIFYDEIQGFMTEAGVTFSQPTSLNNPNLIWSFANTQRDHVPAADAQGYTATAYPANYGSQLIGYYENIEYTNSGSHMTSNEGPFKIEATQAYLTAKPPSGQYVVTVLNSGNFREFTMEIAAGASLMWHGTGTGTGAYSTATFLPKFAGRYFAQGSAPGAGGLGTDPCAGTTLCNDIATAYTNYYNAQWEQKPNDFPGNAIPNEYIFQDLRYYNAAHRMIYNMIGDCYANATKCAAIANVTHPYSGQNPFQDSASSDNYAIVDDPGMDQLDTLINHATITAASFSSILTNCQTEMAQVASGNQPFLEDSLCSNAEAMYDLNEYVLNLANANEHIDDATPATANNYLKLAQTAFVNFQGAYGKRSTAPPFATWYAIGNLTDFDVAQMTTDLGTVLAKYP